MNETKYEKPWKVYDVGSCHFYHVMELPGVGKVGGEWDLRNSIKEYLGPIDLRGKSFLDLGCASGFISFEAESRGADVVAFDMENTRKDLSIVPFIDELKIREEIYEQNEKYINSIKNAFWFSYNALGSKVKVFYGNIYNAGESLGKFDIVMLGQILVHLKYPLDALEVASLLAKEKIIIVEAILDENLPYGLFMPDISNRARFSWWRFSLPLYSRILELLGFKIIYAEISDHLCLAGNMSRLEKLCTIIAERKNN